MKKSFHGAWTTQRNPSTIATRLANTRCVVACGKDIFSSTLDILLSHYQSVKRCHFAAPDKRIRASLKRPTGKTTFYSWFRVARNERRCPLGLGVSTICADREVCQANGNTPRDKMLPTIAARQEKETTVGGEDQLRFHSPKNGDPACARLRLQLCYSPLPRPRPNSRARWAWHRPIPSAPQLDPAAAAAQCPRLAIPHVPRVDGEASRIHVRRCRLTRPRNRPPDRSGICRIPDPAPACPGRPVQNPGWIRVSLSPTRALLAVRPAITRDIFSSPFLPPSAASEGRRRVGLTNFSLVGPATGRHQGRAMHGLVSAADRLPITEG